MNVSLTPDPQLPMVTIRLGCVEDMTKAIAHAQQHLSQGLSKHEPPFYRVVDLTELSPTMGQVVEFLQQETALEPGTASDKRYVPIYVGTDNMVKMIADSLCQEQYGGLDAYHFNTIEAAVYFVRDSLLKSKVG